MDAGTTIEVHNQIPHVEVRESMEGLVYLAKGDTDIARYKDAVEYEEYHGGIIYWEGKKGSKIYRVFKEGVYTPPLDSHYSPGDLDGRY
jgi:hypothetical protein